MPAGHYKFLILLDRDLTDCKELKKQLEEKVCKAGLPTGSSKK
jgi:hypothetical protein